VILFFDVQCRIVKLNAEGRNFDSVMKVLRENAPFFGIIPKAKTAKIVRNILSIIEVIPDTLDTQISLCRDIIAWCEQEKRTFLRQRIEAKVTKCVFYAISLFTMTDLHVFHVFMLFLLFTMTDLHVFHVFMLFHYS
jgi:hypothetical protein